MARRERRAGADRCSGWRRTPSSSATTASCCQPAAPSGSTSKELWTLPGGGLDHGEDPRDAVVREVHEETGLDVTIGETAHVYSFHLRDTWRHGRRVDAHALRIVYDGWVPVDSPEPARRRGRRLDHGGGLAADRRRARRHACRWSRLVTEVLAEHRPFQLQRVAAYALVIRDGRTGRGAADPELAARPAPGLVDAARRRHRPRRGAPRTTVVREVREETGLACTLGDVARRGSTRTSRAPRPPGAARTSTRSRSSSTPPSPTASREVVEVDGTTDARGLGRRVRDLDGDRRRARPSCAPPWRPASVG